VRHLLLAMEAQQELLFLKLSLALLARYSSQLELKTNGVDQQVRNLLLVHRYEVMPHKEFGALFKPPSNSEFQGKIED
jgi:hypothetical protein